MPLMLKPLAAVALGCALLATTAPPNPILFWSGTPRAACRPGFTRCFPSAEGFKIELQDRLALLMGAPNLYPNMQIAASGVSMVAEDRYTAKPTMDDALFSYRRRCLRVHESDA